MYVDEYYFISQNAFCIYKKTELILNTAHTNSIALFLIVIYEAVTLYDYKTHFLDWSLFQEFRASR